jgi:hypothetical protein
VKKLLFKVTKWSIQEVHPLHTNCNEFIHFRVSEVLPEVTPSLHKLPGVHVVQVFCHQMLILDNVAWKFKAEDHFEIVNSLGNGLPRMMCIRVLFENHLLVLVWHVLRLHMDQTGDKYEEFL